MTETPVTSASKEAIRKALSRYRVLAWTTGVWLIVLCANMVLKYILNIHLSWTTFIGPVHGLIYMVYVFFTFDLAVKVRWPIGQTCATALAGTVPLLGVIVEHVRSEDVKKRFDL